MMDNILDRGRRRAATTAEISVLIGNDGAQRAYEKAGFAVVAEARDAEYEATLKSPGMRLMRRSL
jgi:RimJ/RimL family protein N-acetyltransferase